MKKIPAQLVVLPDVLDTGGRVLRVDLRYMLTEASPFTQRSLAFREEPTGIADYGHMLCQWLCRIQGVDAITITHHGCRVELAALYDQRRQVREVKMAVERVLRSRIPWLVYRVRGQSWRYRFSQRVLGPGCQYTTENPNHPLLTPFGRKLFRGFVGSQGGVHAAYDWQCTMKASLVQNWAPLDREYDALLAKLIGTRKVEVAWE